MTERTLGIPLASDVERNERWTKAAFRAAELHDALLDTIKWYHGINFDVGCRSTTSSTPDWCVLEMQRTFAASEGSLTTYLKTV